MDRLGLLMTLLCCGLHFTGGLQCYWCDNESSNTFCVGDHMIRECDVGMDTCQTIVHYSEATESMRIIKTCTKNSSCYQTKQEHQDIPCDVTNKRWICINCCHDDACNINNAHSLCYNCYMIFLHCLLLSYLFN